MKKVLITGSSGYIGQHLVKLLKNSVDLYGIDIVYCDNLNLNVVDIRDKSFIIDEEFDTVIHLAALVNVGDSVNRPWEYYETNLVGTFNVLTKIKFKNFILASTGAADQLTSPYGISKKAAEEITQSYCKIHNKSFTIFRFYNVIGSDGFQPTNPDGLFYNLVNAITENKFSVYGTDYNTYDGTCIRDYVHVMEVCHALKQAIKFPSNSVENLGHGKGHSVKEIVELFKKVNNVNFDVLEEGRRTGDIEYSVLDNPSTYMKSLYSMPELLKIQPTELDNVTLLIKSFMRKGCVDKLLSSIRKFYPTIKVVIVDDSKDPLVFAEDPNLKVFYLPFDSGLSKGRNYGVEQIDTEYFVLLDDDFLFTEKTDLLKFYQIIENNKDQLDVLGGCVLENKKPIEYYGKFIFDENSKTIEVIKEVDHFENFNKCDLILNFFIAKTSKIKEFKWDNDLKLAEHSAFFFENRNNLKVGYTTSVFINHLRLRYPDYESYRSRGRHYFKIWLKKKGIRVFKDIKGNITKNDE